MHRLEQIPKGVVQKQNKGKWQHLKNAYQDKVLCKTAITLQH